MAVTRKAWCWRVVASGRCVGETLMRYGMRAAMGETKVVLPRVGKCEEGSGLVRWGVVWEGFKAYHFREDGDCGGGRIGVVGVVVGYRRGGGLGLC